MIDVSRKPEGASDILNSFLLNTAQRDQGVKFWNVKEAGY